VTFRGPACARMNDRLRVSAVLLTQLLFIHRIRKRQSFRVGRKTGTDNQLSNFVLRLLKGNQFWGVAEKTGIAHFIQFNALALHNGWSHDMAIILLHEIEIWKALKAFVQYPGVYQARVCTEGQKLCNRVCFVSLRYVKK